MRAPWLALLGSLVLAAACGPPQTAGAGSETTPPREEPDDAEGEGGETRTEPAEVGGREPTLQERAVIQRLSLMAERVRGLAFERPVDVAIQDRDQIVEHLTEQIIEEDLAKARVVYVALGLLPPDIDLRDVLERVLGEQVVGYYDHDTAHLVVRDDVMHTLGRSRALPVDEARVTIVHELVHALQDQRLGLSEHMDEDTDTDPENAYHALVEGDATLAMIGYMTEQAGGRLEWITRNPAQLRMVLGQAPPIGDENLSNAPAIVRIPLVSAYLDGLVFAASLHGRGGWRAVDAAHRALPASSEQILHPDLYEQGELPDAIAIGELPELTAAGLTVFDEDSLGELELSVYMGQLDGSANAAAAAGWSGDRLRVYRDAQEATSVVWFMAFDDEGEAREAEDAARRVRAAAPPAEQARQSLLRIGRGLLLTRQLDAGLLPPVERAFGAFARSLPPSPPHTPPP